jgi:MarR family transcriptional regulator, lower aerobic nicotinate degradation pathway regulator
MPTLAKSSRKPEQLKSKPVKATAKTATKPVPRPAVPAPAAKVPPAKTPAVKTPSIAKPPVAAPLVAKPAEAAKVAPAKVSAAKAAAAKPPHPLAAMASTVEYVLEDQVGFHLRRAHQRATGIFNDIMAPYDVTPTQFAALAKIDELGAVSQTFLGRLTGMDAATILGVVGRLLRQGLIVARAALSVSAKTLSPLSSAEAKTLAQLLAKLM